MKFLVISLFYFLTLANPENISSPSMHTANTGELNLASLNKVESLIRKKAGAELSKNHENSFSLNGYFVSTEVEIRNFGPSIYEESFYEIENPENIYRLRLVKNVEGDYEFAVMIHGEEGFENYHAVFDSQGIMFEEDPWGQEDGYTIDIFALYQKYQNIFSKKVDGK